MKKLSLEEKIGQLFLVSLDGLQLDDAARQFLARTHAGNVILFGNNAGDIAQVRALNADIAAYIEAGCGIPPMLSVDHEGGRVTRFRNGVTVFPPAMAVGATGNPALAEAIGAAMGRELRALGFSMNYAPVLDVNVNPQNPVIGLRSYGDDPARVAEFGVSMARGMMAEELAPCGKHFPGHGDTAVDSHFGLPMVDKPFSALMAVELLPFVRAIEAGIPALMTSHILFPQLDPEGLPATLSGRILQGLLREKLGFDGLIITDGMQMHAITKFYGIEKACVQALRAGADMLCVGTGGAGTMPVQEACYQAVLDAVREGSLPMERVEASLRRVLAYKERYANRHAPAVDWAEDQALAQRVADASIVRMGGDFASFGGSVVCASLGAIPSRSGVTQANWQGRGFADMLADEMGASALLIEPEMDFGVLEAADQVVICIRRGDEEELAVLRHARQRGKQTAVVLTGLPYLQALLPPGTPALCAFGTEREAAVSVAKVLRGEMAARGTLPVKM